MASIDEEKPELNDIEDAKKNKYLALLAYIVFFIPLIAAPESKFARFHANQAITLLFAFICFFILGAILQKIGIFLVFIDIIFTILLTLIGFFNALTGRTKKLPIIGAIRILR